MRPSPLRVPAGHNSTQVWLHPPPFCFGLTALTDSCQAAAVLLELELLVEKNSSPVSPLGTFSPFHATFFRKKNGGKDEFHRRGCETMNECGWSSPPPGQHVKMKAAWKVEIKAE